MCGRGTLCTTSVMLHEQQHQQKCMHVHMLAAATAIMLARTDTALYSRLSGTYGDHAYVICVMIKPCLLL